MGTVFIPAGTLFMRGSSLNTKFIPPGTLLIPAGTLFMDVSSLNGVFSSLKGFTDADFQTGKVFFGGGGKGSWGSAGKDFLGTSGKVNFDSGSGIFSCSETAGCGVVTSRLKTGTLIENIFQLKLS